MSIEMPTGIHTSDILIHIPQGWWVTSALVSSDITVRVLLSPFMLFPECSKVLHTEQVEIIYAISSWLTHNLSHSFISTHSVSSIWVATRYRVSWPEGSIHATHIPHTCLYIIFLLVTSHAVNREEDIWHIVHLSCLHHMELLEVHGVDIADGS